MTINIDYFKKTKRGGGGNDSKDGSVINGIGILKININLVRYEVL